jgi:hypothetical protein
VVVAIGRASDYFGLAAEPNPTSATDRSRPPFCATVDWVAAAIVAIAVTAGVDFG